MSRLDLPSHGYSCDNGISRTGGLLTKAIKSTGVIHLPFQTSAHVKKVMLYSTHLETEEALHISVIEIELICLAGLYIIFNRYLDFIIRFAGFTVASRRALAV